jgi:hypothetical protein
VVKVVQERSVANKTTTTALHHVDIETCHYSIQRHTGEQLGLYASTLLPAYPRVVVKVTNTVQ